LERLAPILAAFERDYPDIEVFVRESSAAALLESIRQHKVDFGVGPVLEATDLHFDPILEDPLYAVMHTEFGLPYDTTITLRELCKLPLLLLDHTTALRALVEEAAARLGLTLNTRYQFTQAQTLISMASSALGVAILPRVALPGSLNGALRAVRIVDPPLARQLALITLRGHSLSPAASKLVPLFRESLDPGKPRARKSGTR
jgi:DNA-binding transcriptional LysR family regulator